MAFANKIGSLLKHAVSCKPSIYQAVRLMSSSKLFVGGLSYSTDDQSLREAFSGYGEVVESKVIIDRETGRSRGFGFITYTSGEEASAAVTAMDGKDLHGRMVRVNYANDRRPGFVGGGGGGYGGGGYGVSSGGYSGGYGSSGGGYGGGGYDGGSRGDSYGSGGYAGNYVAGGAGGSSEGYVGGGAFGQNQGSGSAGFGGGSDQYNFNLDGTNNNQYGSKQPSSNSGLNFGNREDPDYSLKDDFDEPDDYANRRG